MPRLSLVAVPTFAILAVAAACSSSQKPAAEGSRDEFVGETRDTEIKHEPCEPGGKTAKTFKGESAFSSNKSYVTHVYEGDREVCSYADLNGDGNIDIYTYFGPDGKIRRREASYSVGKGIDEIAIYANGELQVVMRETNFDGRLDTWDYYEGGKLVRRERDKTGDGRLDEWWTFVPGTDNATIVAADIRTGKPDPTQTINIGFGGAAANAPKAAPVAKPDAGPGDAKSTTPALTPNDSTGAADAGAPSAAKDAGKAAAGKDAGPAKKGP